MSAINNPLLFKDNHLKSRITNNKTIKATYNNNDQLVSLRVTTNKQGTIIKEIEYDSYGNITKDTNKSFKTHFNYAGGFYDEDTNLIRFGKRDYSPEQRRWSAIDPILFDGGDLNLYGYVLSDPIQFVDPKGLKGVIGSIWDYFFGMTEEEIRKKKFCMEYRRQIKKGKSPKCACIDIGSESSKYCGTNASCRADYAYWTVNECDVCKE